MSAVDGTLRQLLAEIYACHREIEELRKELEAARALLAQQQKAADAREP